MSDNKLLIAGLVIVGLALAGSLYYVFRSSKEPPPSLSQIAIPQATPQPSPQTQPATQPATPAPQPQEQSQPAKPAFVLPTLDDSDKLIRDGVVSLTRNEAINGWLGPSQLIRRCVAFIDNVAHGNVSRTEVPFLSPNKPFKATKLTDDEFLMDPASYDRYNQVTNIFASIDSKRAAKFYVLVRPLFEKAYAELGYPNKDFDKVIFSAISRLLKTPVINGPIRLVRPSVMYKFADPKLESLSAVQKQLIRMGPENTKAIKAKLTDMEAALHAALDN